MRSSEGEALSGIKVLDLCRVVSGPFATMHLGDLGADVVKIEYPRHGDESRRYGPPFIGGESAYFLSVNRNKRSCTVDLKAPAGRDVVLALAGVADVVVENFRPGTLDKWGLSYESMSATNSRHLARRRALHHQAAQGRTADAGMAGRSRSADIDRRKRRRSDDGNHRDDAGVESE
jgi:crotonobetainyl-CoA:carnitine CoA-transferase CaiB-like acyl-CoA transferase